MRPHPGQWIPEGNRPASKWISREQRLQRTVSSVADTEFPSVKSCFGNGMCLRRPILGEIRPEGQAEKASLRGGVSKLLKKGGLFRIVIGSSH